MVKKPFALAAMGLMLFGATEARAQVSADATCAALPCSATVTATASITIDNVLYIELNSGTIDFNNPTGADFQAGSIASTTTHTLTHSGNTTHDVEVQAATDLFNFTGTGTPNKPAGDLQYSLDAGATFSAIPAATGAADVLHAAAPAGSHSETIDYQLALNYSDVPGDYNLDVNYTIVAN